MLKPGASARFTLPWRSRLSFVLALGLCLGLIAAVLVPVSAQAVSGAPTATVLSVSRSASTGYFELSGSVSASDYAFDGGACSARSWCQIGLQAITANGSTVGLGSFSAPVPADERFGGSTSHSVTASVVASRVVSIQAYVAGYGRDTVYSEPVAISDPYPTQSLSAKVLSVERDPKTGYLVISGEVRASNFSLPDSTCAGSGWCSLGLQVIAKDGSTQTIGAVDPKRDEYPAVHTLSNTIWFPEAVSVRAVLGASGRDTVYSEPIDVTDIVPRQKVGLEIESISRADEGGLTLSATASAQYVSLPGATCTGNGWCDLVVELKTEDGDVRRVAGASLDQQGNRQERAIRATGLQVDSIVALRVGVRAYATEPANGPWIPVSESVQNGHDLDDALGLALAVVSASAVPCVELFPVGTHNSGSSVSDQQKACLAATQGGNQTIKQFLRVYLKTLSGPQVTRFLASLGIKAAQSQKALLPRMDYGEDLPSGCSWSGISAITCAWPDKTTTYRPNSAPAPQDSVYENNQVERVQRNNPGLQVPTAPAPPPAPEPVPGSSVPPAAPAPYVGPLRNATRDDYVREIVRQCEQNLAQWGDANGLSDDACSTTPIFATGSDVAEATQHDLEAITANPEWFQLTFMPQDQKLAAIAPETRSWHQKTSGCADKVIGQNCDEFPYFSSHEGVKFIDLGNRQLEPLVSLKSIDGRQNQLQGSWYGQFSNQCRLPAATSPTGRDQEFLVVPMKVTPTMYLCTR
jgi:hypothetical protein